MENVVLYDEEQQRVKDLAEELRDLPSLELDSGPKFSQSYEWNIDLDNLDDFFIDENPQNL